MLPLPPPSDRARAPGEALAALRAAAPRGHHGGLQVRFFFRRYVGLQPVPFLFFLFIFVNLCEALLWSAIKYSCRCVGLQPVSSLLL